MYASEYVFLASTRTIRGCEGSSVEVERLRRLVGVSVVLLVVFSNTMLSIPGCSIWVAWVGAAGWARGYG